MFRIYKKEYNKASPNNSQEWKNESDFNKLKQDFNGEMNTILIS